MKPLWKVTFTQLSIHMLGFYLATGKKPNPPSWTKVYRWKWRAKFAAFQMPTGTGVFLVTKVEPYWPDSNIVPLRKSA